MHIHCQTCLPMHPQLRRALGKLPGVALKSLSSFNLRLYIIIAWQQQSMLSCIYSALPVYRYTSLIVVAGDCLAISSGFATTIPAKESCPNIPLLRLVREVVQYTQHSALLVGELYSP